MQLKKLGRRRCVKILRTKSHQGSLPNLLATGLRRRQLFNTRWQRKKGHIKRAEKELIKGGPHLEFYNAPTSGFIIHGTFWLLQSLRRVGWWRQGGWHTKLGRWLLCVGITGCYICLLNWNVCWCLQLWIPLFACNTYFKRCFPFFFISYYYNKHITINSGVDYNDDIVHILWWNCDGHR